MIHCDPDKRPKPEDLFVSFRTEGGNQVDDIASFENINTVLSAANAAAGKVTDTHE